MRVKAVMERSGVDRETLRFYETKGLLPGAVRTASNYREYPEEILSRLHFIRTAQAAGFTLSEIRALIDLRETGASCRQGRDMVLKKLLELKDTMKSLREMTRILDTFVTACESKGERGLNQKCHLSFDGLAAPSKNVPKRKARSQKS